MARRIINLGTSPNKGDGDPLRIAMTKINDNFDELYNELGPQRDIVGVEVRGEDSTVLVNGIDSTFNLDGTVKSNIAPTDNLAYNIGNELARFARIYGSVSDRNSRILVDAENGSINLNGTVKGDVVPDQNEVYDLGQANARFKDLYLSGNSIFLGDGKISVNPVTGEFEFTGDVRQVVVTQRDVVGNLFAQDSTLVVDGATGEVKNLGGEAPSYYLDYNNFTNVPTLTLSDILANGGAAASTLPIQNVTGDGTGSITEFLNISSTVGGTISGYDTLTGTASGDITGYNNIVGNNLGDIGGYVNVRARDNFIVNNVSFGSTQVTQWNDAYSWGDHNLEGYATITYVDTSVAQVLNSQGFVTFWNNQFLQKTTDNLAEGSNNLYYTESRVRSILNDELDPYASQAYVTTQINNLKGTAPGDLNTLGEIAAAINNDANYYNTVNQALALKFNIADFDTTFDTNFAAKTTTALTEGANLYYTDARVLSYLTNNNYATQAYVTQSVADLIDAAPATLDTLNELAAALGDDPNFATTVTNNLALKLNAADFNDLFDTRFGTKNTSDIPEGANLYYTNTRVRNAINVVDAGGDGSMVYNTGTGTITYTGPTALEVRAHLSGDGDISYDSATGTITFNNTTGYLTEVTANDFAETALTTDQDAFEDTNDKLMTAAAIDDLIRARITVTAEIDTLDTVVKRSNTTDSEVIVAGLTTSTITAADSSSIDFGDTQLENVIIDFGSYSG